MYIKIRDYKEVTFLSKGHLNQCEIATLRRTA